MTLKRFVRLRMWLTATSMQARGHRICNAILWFCTGVCFLWTVAHLTKPMTTNQGCDSVQRLIEANTAKISGFDVRGSVAPWNADPKVLTWTVYVTSTDRQLRLDLTGTNYCDLLNQSWDKLDAYNAYVRSR